MSPPIAPLVSLRMLRTQCGTVMESVTDSNS